VDTLPVTNPYLLLERNAKAKPNGVFFRSAHQVMTNAEAVVEVKKLAYELRRLGVQAEHVVALDLPDQLSILFMEAIYHEAAVCTVLPDRFDSTGVLTIDWIFSNRPQAPQGNAVVVTVDAAFLQLVGQNPYGIRPSETPVDTLRIVFSSGTTGTPKAIALGYTALKPFDDALETWFEGDPFLVLMDLGTPWGFGGFYLSVEGGRPFLCVGAASPAEIVTMAVDNTVTSLKGSPAQIASFVAEAEAQQRTLPHIQSVYVGGTVMPTGVAERMRAVAEGCTIYGMYGATETGIATSRVYESDDPSNAGQILPGARVEVVGDDDVPVSDGVPGRIRHQTPGMVHEYLGDPYATAQSFRDGWFYPGDLGFLRPDGGLTLTGRESEVLNAGGVKIDPNRLDQFALAETGVIDACAFDYAGDSGIRRIGIALVTKDDIDVTALVARFSAEFGNAAPALVARVDTIPRNTMGKPMRRILAERYSEG
jgi:long-chain acyl-CoA synthetase